MRKIKILKLHPSWRGTDWRGHSELHFLSDIQKNPTGLYIAGLSEGKTSFSGEQPGSPQWEQKHSLTWMRATNSTSTSLYPWVLFQRAADKVFAGAVTSAFLSWCPNSPTITATCNNSTNNRANSSDTYPSELNNTEPQTRREGWVPRRKNPLGAGAASSCRHRVKLLANISPAQNLGWAVI